MADQPTPTTGTGDLWASLLRATPMPRSLRILCRERRALGVRRYGIPLQLDNGRDMRRDAREEALDLAVYLWGLSSLCAREGRWIVAWGWRMVARGVLVVAWVLR